MKSTRTRVLVALIAVAALALLTMTAAGTVPGATSDDPTAPSSGISDEYTADRPAALSQPESDSDSDRPDDPSTSETIGYVEGYWHDDDLPVDDRDDAVVDDDELEAVVYRSMARVEYIRNRTYEDDVPVDVISREEFQADNDALFVNVTEDQRIHENVAYEALFMVDRETDAIDEAETLYGGAVGGYYDPEADEIVLVSNNPETPELNEPVLGHELVHALQDQRFDLESFERETLDEDNAKNGLIEGDASRVETLYEEGCEVQWDCATPNGGQDQPTDLNWGLYLSIFQPYDDGPDYVEYLYERGGWDAVDAAYDDPPASSSEVIRPGEEREPANITIADNSSDDWQQLEVEGTVANETVGEAGMVAMFGGGALADDEPTVIGRLELVEPDLGFDYDQPYTNGWAGDRLVTYINDDGLDAANATAAADHAGYVWQTEWTSGDDGQQFLEGYLELLAGYGAEPVDDRQDTYVIDEDGDYPGAYYIDRADDGETVTIVRAPSVDALEDVEAGAAPAGDDTLAASWPGDGGDADGSSSEPDDTAGNGTEQEQDQSDGIPGIGGTMPILVVGIVVGTVSALAVARGRR